MKVILALALFACLQFATCNKQVLTALSHVSRMRRSLADMHQGGRFKRQSEICIMRCREEMEEKTVDLENFDALAEGSFDPTMGLNEDMLVEFCDIFEIARVCFDSCGDFPMKDMIMGIPDYICVEHFDDFIEALPCYQKMEPQLENCMDKCGGKDYIDDQESKIESLTKSGDIGGMMGMLGDMCGYMSCLLECQRPVSVNVCGDTKAADLFQGFAAMAMRESKNMLDKIGMGSLFPKECTAVFEDEQLPKCEQEGPVVGPCRASITKYYYDLKSKSCKSFLYGGCEGNDNRFDSYTDCNTECVMPFVDGSQGPKFYLQQVKGSSSFKTSLGLLLCALLFLLFR